MPLDPDNLTTADARQLYMERIAAVQLVSRLRRALVQHGGQNSEAVEIADIYLARAVEPLRGRLIIEQQKSGDWFVDVDRRPR